MTTKIQPGKFRSQAKAPYWPFIVFLIVFAATAVRPVFLKSIGTSAPYLTFYPAVIAAALYGGLWSGLLATALSAIIVDFLFLGTAYQFTIETPADLLSLSFFSFSSIMISIITEAMRRTREMLKERTTALEQEIVERKQVEITLRENEQRLNFHLENSPLAVVEWDTNFLVTQWSKEAEHIFGWKKEEVIGKRIDALNIIYEKDTPIVNPMLERLTSGKERTVISSNRNNTKAGVVIECIWYNSVLLDENGRMTSVMSLAQDITESKRIQEALATSEKEFRLLAEAMPQIVWITRADGWAIYCNQQCVDYTGLTREESYGHGWNKPFHPGDKQRAWDAWQNAVQNNGTYSIECQLRRKDGVYRWWLIRGIPVFGDSGKIVKWFGTCTDIHDMKRHEKELAETNKELESFSYSVAHDLRGPLRVMTGFSDLLNEDYADKLDDEVKGNLLRIKKSGEKMNSLIDDMLSLSKITRQGISYQDVDMSALANNIIKDFKESSPDRKISISIAENLHVHADEKLLTLALQNLLRNAWKYTSKIADSRIEFGTFEKDNERIYFIKDNGAGFDMRYAKILFEPFRRLHPDSEFPGTGIGLAIVDRVIKRHGGRIWAEGKINEGASFYFTIN